VYGGYCPVRASANIPEAIHHPWELSLSGSRSDLHGAHLTLPASEDIRANGHGGPATPPAEAKRSLREALLARRDAFHAGLDATARQAAQTAIAGRLEPLFRHVRTVAGYAAVDSEPDVTPALGLAEAMGCRILYPHVTTKTKPMRFLFWSTTKPLEPGPYDLRQPPPDAEEAAPDLILTPLVGFDRALRRLGHGAGFYDRYFARMPGARRIGVAWAVQEADALPTDPWDVPMEAIITEREWIGAEARA
jgi:5-formyltetrahydrofolate cyclo-ligase